MADVKYFAYVRKSSEGDERQALSIDSQKDQVVKHFADLDIVEVLEEKHSAFKPYNRPVFADMIKRIHKGEANGIIAWHPDRLSRNEIDASTITYLVRTNVILDLKFVSYNFDNSPEGIMMLQLALSQSQYFSSKLGKDVKRGLDKKLELGWFPGVAPEGYLNDMRLEKGQRTIIIDKKRFPILRKAFELLLTGAYSAEEVRRILNNEWGYLMRPRGKTGSTPLTRTTWYGMLSKPFYAGIITYRGEEYKGKHKPLISIDEFNRIQDILGERGAQKKPKKKDFTYAGVFTCGFCGCAITAEHKSKYIKSKQEMKGYNYYHCTHRKADIACKQGSVEEQQITEYIEQTLADLSLHPKFLEWGMEYIESEKSSETSIEKKVQETIEDKKAKVREQISELTKMRAKGLLDDDEYLEEKKALKTQISTLQEDTTAKQESNFLDALAEALEFSTVSAYQFKDANKREKREILSALGSNHAIMDKKLLITAKKELSEIIKITKPFDAKIRRLEPAKFGSVATKNEALEGLRSAWLRGRGSNPRPRD